MADTKFGQAMGKASDFLGSSKGQGIMSAATDLGNSFVKTQAQKGKNPTGYQTQQSIGNALMSFPHPIVQAAGAAFKAVSGIAEATGGNINTINKEQAKDLGISGGQRVLNNVLGTLHPGAGWLTKKVEEGQKSFLIDEMSNAYSDTVADIDQAQTLGGGKYLFGKNKIADAVAESNRRNQLLTDINMTNTMRKKSDYGRDLAQQNLNRYAGTNYTDMRMGRNGMKFPGLDEVREMLRNRVEVNTDVQKFADGGTLYPQGKLHKERHHIEDLAPELEDVITKKGIPVVTLDDGGQIQAIAEIERDEIVLSKEITDQIEALWKDGSEEAMIKTGKIMTNEIFTMKNAEEALKDE